jgi:hypothetical protein
MKAVIDREFVVVDGVSHRPLRCHDDAIEDKQQTGCPLPGRHQDLLGGGCTLDPEGTKPVQLLLAKARVGSDQVGSFPFHREVCRQQVGHTKLSSI